MLLDTGVIVALLDRSEKFHRQCAEAVRKLDAPLITCEAVMAESCYLVRNLPGAPEAIIANAAEGIFQIPFQLSREALAVRTILRKYQDRAIDLADACLIHLANEFETGGCPHAGQGFRNLPMGKEPSVSVATKEDLAPGAAGFWAKILARMGKVLRSRKLPPNR
jgi:uncharacterized protein